MTRHLLRLIWNRKRQNFLLTRRDLLLVPDAVRGRALRRALRQQRAAAARLRHRSACGASRVDRKEPDEDPAVKARHRETYRQLLLALARCPQVEGVAAGFTGPVRQLQLGQRHSPGGRPRGRLRREQRHRRLSRRCCSIPLVADAGSRAKTMRRPGRRSSSTSGWRGRSSATRTRSDRSSRRNAIPNGPPPDPNDKPRGQARHRRRSRSSARTASCRRPSNYLFHRMRLDGAEPEGVAARTASSCALRPGTTAAFEETLVKRADGGRRSWSFEVAAARHHARGQAAPVHDSARSSSARSRRSCC